MFKDSLEQNLAFVKKIIIIVRRNNNKKNKCTEELSIVGVIRSHSEKCRESQNQDFWDQTWNTKNVNQMILILDDAVLRLSDWHRLRESWHTRKVAVTRTQPTEQSSDIIGQYRPITDLSVSSYMLSDLRQILQNVLQKEMLGMI